MKTLRIKIIAGLVIISFLVAFTLALFTAVNTKRLFSDYLNEYREARQVQWARVLAQYYLQRGSWLGVSQILPVSREHGMMGMMRGRRVTSGELIVLADSQGSILAATERFTRETLRKDEIQRASSIKINEQLVGYVYLKVEYEIPGLATMESQFLSSVYYSTIIGGLLAAIIAALVGISFSNRLVLPLRRLTESAQRITRGQWDVNVDIDREDEVGELAKAFSKMADKLRETEMARKTLVADVAHELRNPLATLRAQLESIQEGVTKPEPDQILLLNDEVIRLSRLVNDLQDLSLAEVGKLNLNKEQTRLDLLLKKVTDYFEGTLREKEIKLIMEVTLLSSISMDSQRIKQVIINLLMNAIRHTPYGKRIIISGQERDEEIYIEIYNEGDPILTKDLPHIFNRFYRADQGRSREQGGSGLGLAITRGLIEAHGGSVGAANMPEGVKFFFTLPK